MTTYIDPEDMSEEEAAEFEAARVAFVRICKDLEPARERYQKAKDKAVKARKAETARAEKAKEKIMELAKAANALYGPVEHANSARQRLLSTYVPRVLYTERDRSSSDLVLAQRTYEEAVIRRKRQEASIERRSQRMVHGAIKDRQGRLQYHAQTDEDKRIGRAAQVKMGMVRNPVYWGSEEDKQAAKKALEKLELQEAELLSKVQKFAKIANAAQAKLDAAQTDAFRE